MAKTGYVRRVFTMPEATSKLLDAYSEAMGLTPSAFVNLCIRQIDQVFTSLGGLKEELVAFKQEELEVDE